MARPPASCGPCRSASLSLEFDFDDCTYVSALQQCICCSVENFPAGKTRTSGSSCKPLKLCCPSTLPGTLDSSTWYESAAALGAETLRCSPAHPQTATTPRTYLAYQHDSTQYTLETTIVSVIAFPDLADANRALFKQATDKDHVVTCAATIFHPQGGGQPSDTGTIVNSTSTTFTVSAARQDVVNDGQVLHLGSFSSNDHFNPRDNVVQHIDVEKRLLYSRLHTAGHVLGAAVNHLLSQTVPDFKELKASHFPDAASCEFRGLIDGKHKEGIQTKVNEFAAAKMPVEIVWWDGEDFEREGVEMPDHTVELPPGEKWRVVKIVGAEAYPCGGTHVADSGACGDIGVKKISRSKGTSKVSYTVS